MEDGLSNNFIRDIVQDSSGFMWFATEDGLNKYDGYTFTVYRNDPANPASLSQNTIENLEVDKNGKVWVGTDGGGLNVFDPETEEFTRYNMDSANPDRVSKEFIYSMHVDKSGRIWFCVQGKGLYNYDPETQKFAHYAHNPDDQNSISSNLGLLISGTIETGREILWVATWGAGLNKFDIEKNRWTHFWHNPENPNSLYDNYIGRMYADKSG